MSKQVSLPKSDSIQRLRLLALGACASATLLVLDAAAEAAPTYKAKTLATGLESPRGVAIGPNGNLVLSEAGRGGNGSCLTTATGNSVCYGTSGALGLFNFSTNTYSRAITGLPSLARQDNYTDATGLNKLTFNGSGQLMGVFGNEGGASPFLDEGQWFGQTVSINLAGSTVTPLANITAFEVSNNPHPTAVDSNPWDLVVSGGDTYVTDAAGNSLVKANSANQVSLVYLFPNKIVNTPTNAPSGTPPQVSAQTVPTGLTIGSDGALYIAQLSGLPFAPGSADVFRYDFVNPVTTFASGFSNLVDIAAGPDNSLYLLQYRNDFWASSPTGSILRLSLDGSGSVETLFSDLVNPTALAVDPDGTIYVTNNGNGDDGELLQLTPQSVPAPLPIFGLGLAWTQARRLRRRCGGLGGSTRTRPAASPAPVSCSVC